MGKSDEAVNRFNQGFNCAQAVLSAFAADHSLDEKMALRVSGAFGGGIARLGQTCGAVTGALMVLGLRHGMDSPERSEAKEFTYVKVHRFMEAFKARCGSTVCRELIGCDLSAPGGMEAAKQKGVFETVCPRLVKEAVEILDGMA